MGPPGDREVSAADDVNAEAREQRELQADAVDREYAAGVATISDVLEVRRHEYDAIIGEIDSRFQLAVERLSLITLSGRDLISGENP